MAILTTTSLDVQSGVVTASILIPVQNAVIPTIVVMTEAELLAIAAQATPPRTDWDTSDVCTFCSTAIGLVVTVPMPAPAPEPTPEPTPEEIV